MTRAPLQVIVIPFRKCDGKRFEYAVFHRADTPMWHFVSGGAEDSETASEAARREAFEEAAIPASNKWVALDSKASVPRSAFASATHWPTSLFVVPEHAFSVDVTNHTIVLSHEHDEVRWLSFPDAAKLLTWDSNRVALWELNERLTAGGERPA